MLHDLGQAAPARAWRTWRPPGNLLPCQNTASAVPCCPTRTWFSCPPYPRALLVLPDAARFESTLRRSWPPTGLP